MFRILHLCRKIPEVVGEDSWSLLSCHSWQLEWGFIMTCMCRWSDAEMSTRVFGFLYRSPRIFRAFLKLIHSIDITCRAAVYSPILSFPHVQALCPRRSETLCLPTWNGWSQMCLRCKTVWSLESLHLDAFSNTHCHNTRTLHLLPSATSTWSKFSTMEAWPQWLSFESWFALIFKHQQRQHQWPTTKNQRTTPATPTTATAEAGARATATARAATTRTRTRTYNVV